MSVPAQVPLVELLPGIVHELGALSPGLVHGGFSLRRADGTALDPAVTCAAQGVHDGAMLVLVQGAFVAERRRYDDVVEAVIDATTGQRAPWTPQDHARTALGVSLTLLALGAGLLAVGSHGVGLPVFVAFGGALVLLAVGAVLTRVGQPTAGSGLGLAAAAYAAVGAYLLAPVTTVWTWPLAAAGLGLAVVGGVATVVSGAGRRVHLVPVIGGAVLGTTALVAALISHDGPVSVAPYAVAVAVVGAGANLLPWLVLSSTRISAISPQSDAEILAPPPLVDGDDVARRTARGHALALSTRVALGLSVLVATPLVAADSVAGTVLCALVFLGMMFESRQVYARSDVTALMGLATAGLALTGTVAAMSGTVGRTPLLLVLLAATVGLVGLSLLSTGAHMRLARWYDTAEALCLAALLPLGAFAAGLV